MVPASTLAYTPQHLPIMDPTDRLTAPPAGPMPPMTRGVSDTTVIVNGRRPLPGFNGPTATRAPTPPISSLRSGSTNSASVSTSSASNLSASTGLPPSQVIALARDAMKNSLESENQVAEAGAVGASLKPGVTVDLSRRNIQKIPEEVVDIVKNDLERLALSHNQISSLPVRFSECTSLRYLNIRANQISEFPMPLCDLKSLEILDLGRNLLRVLPPDIARLTSLKVLSVRKNELRELPLCLADMGSLQVLKFEGNPLVFPSKEALPNHVASPSQDPLRDNEVTDVVMTAQVKRFLRQHMSSGRLEPEQQNAGGDDSSEGAETPRVMLKRRVSGRFPVKVSGADLPDTRSPSTGRAPPIPQRSHYRGLSQQNTSTRRPGVMPLTLGSASERTRSNSETLLRSERPESRNRRMGIVPKKGSDLGTVDETQANNRFSHYRGLSHGSAMQGGNPVPVGPNDSPTPSDQYSNRPIYVRRLSILPERRRQSQAYYPVVEAAKGILYSVFQIHPMIQMLMSLANDEATKRSSLEIVFYNTNSHVEELEREIQKHDLAVARDDHTSYSNTDNVLRACQTLVGAYGHVCTLLADNADTFVDNGDPRYIRTLLMLIYNSIMELRVTISTANEPGPVFPPAMDAGSRRISDTDSLNEAGYTVRPQQVREVLPTPKTAIRPGISRSRNGTMVHNPANLRVATNVTMPTPGTTPYSVDPMTASATPRSGESFASAMSRDVSSETSTEEDAQFDRIFLSLQKSADIVLRTLPNFNVQLSGRLRNTAQSPRPGAGNAGGLTAEYKALIAMCNNTIQQTEVMRSRLSHIKLKEPGVRSQPGFWNLCSNFIVSWTNMAYRIWSVINTVPLPQDTRARLKPIQKSIKETSAAIMQSPWSHLVHTSAPNGGSPGNTGLPPSAVAAGMMSPTQITPQSAALGPAMQATVSGVGMLQSPSPGGLTPKTPSSQQQPQVGSSLFAAAFHGNVFDRADALMANPGISMGRPGMPRKGHSNLSSLSSVSSLSSDGTGVPSSATTPAPPMSPTAATSAPPTTTPAQAAASPPAAAATESSSPPSSSSDASVPPLLHDTLPSASTERQIQSARAAVVASMSNMVDRELAPRARVLHDNTAALAAQEEQVARATGDMARANDRLQREADAAGAVLKEVGHVQNWAEVLEREFLVVEETLRLANGGSDDGSSGSLCSCSECGRDDNRQGADGEDDVVMPDAVADDKNKTEDKDGVTWSEASRSVQDSGASTASS